jgi:hypothetical protein
VLGALLLPAVFPAAGRAAAGDGPGTGGPSVATISVDPGAAGAPDAAGAGGPSLLYQLQGPSKNYGGG